MKDVVEIVYDSMKEENKNWLAFEKNQEEDIDLVENNEIENDNNSTILNNTNYSTINPFKINKIEGK
jgi:hypothetical protein